MNVVYDVVLMKYSLDCMRLKTRMRRASRVAGFGMLGVACLALGAVPQAWAKQDAETSVAAADVLQLVAQANAQSAKPQQFTLSNGMDVIVLEDKRAPVAVQMLWVRAGATEEVDGSSGVAHALEHMMFKGTPTVPAGEFSKRVAALGGEDNAFTSRDYTAYYQQVPSNRLEQVMKLEADRFANTKWSEEDFRTEMQVIREERRQRTDDSPRALLHEAMYATMFAASPYGRPVVGWMGDLHELRSDELFAFYKTWYQPSNAALVIVGDVDTQQVRTWAQRYYGAIPNQKTAVRKTRPEPEQKGLKRMKYHAPAEQPYVVMAWRAPEMDVERKALSPVLNQAPTADEQGKLFAINPEAQDVGSKDVYAMNMLAAVLDTHDGSRLPKALVQGKDRIADSVGAYMGFASRGPGLFTVVATPAQGKTVAQLEAAIRAEIQRVADEGVSQKELDRVKVQWAAAQVYEQDSVMGKAQNMGRNWALGWPLDADDRVMRRFAQVTPADVQRVAATYFGDKTLTVAELVPEPLDAATAAKQRRSASMAGGDHVH